MKRVPILVDCEKRHKSSNGRFELPPKSERDDLEPGETVKLVWEDKNNRVGECGERMWVEITMVISLGGRRRYKGKLSNDPFYFEGVMELGQEIDFGPENIAAIE